MADRGAKYADKKLSEIDRELRKVYRQAQKELTSKLSGFNKRFRAKDREKQQQMDKGEISKQQYKDWLAGQVFMRGQWERKLDQVNEIMLHHNEQAMRIINESRLDVFAENYYSEAFKANWIIQDVGFNVYSTHAIARLLEKQPQILPKWKIDEEKDYKWNEKKVNNIIQQGIIQGESVDQIGRRLCEDLCSQNESKMTMFARTAITGAQNAGRQVQMEQAAAAGIKVNKRWIATMDNRTRDLHRARDGEEVAYDDEFSGGIEYPGDPTAPPEEVYNCRCTMETVYPEYADRSKEWREDEEIDGVPYEEWKEGAKVAHEEIGARMGAQAKRTIESIGAYKIEPIGFSKLKQPLTDSEIIKKVSRYDPTSGSCASVAFAYIANKAGYDVQDFRGGESEKCFKDNFILAAIAKLPGVSRSFYRGKNDFKAAEFLFGKMETGKEYFMTVGNHAAIVEKQNDVYKYIEMQDKGKSNGHYILNRERLEYRFGCDTIHKNEFGEPTAARSFIIDVESLMKSEDFINIMYFVNSKEN